MTKSYVKTLLKIVHAMNESRHVDLLNFTRFRAFVLS